MKILLVIPRFYDTKAGGRFYEMPLGLAYINAALRKAGFDVECLNMNHIEDEDIYGVLRKTIIKGEIGYVLCGAITPFIPVLKKVFDTAKEVRQNIVTIAGGGAVTSEPIAFAELTDIDYAVVGEGEITDVELLQTLMDGGDVSRVKGIVYKTEEGYKQTAPREPIENLDTIEFPCYEGFDVDKYLDDQNLGHTYYTYYTDRPRIMPMTLARSCPYQCKFCFHPVGNRYRVRSLDNFFAELDVLIEKYQLNGILILDELFSASVEKIYEFCKRIRPYNIHWLVQMRVDIISEDLLRMMKEAGCFTISYGLESFSKTVLKNMRKHIEPADIERALQITYEVGIDIQGNFIFGDELEDKHTIYETLSWWFRHPMYAINLALIETYPGSGYYEECVKNGKIVDVKEFIRRGAYVINLTQLSDVEYNRLAVLFNILYWYYNKNVGKMLELYEDEEGRITFVTQCVHCGAVNKYVGIDGQIFSRGKFQLGCRQCNHRNAFFSVVREELPHFEEMEYLCRMLAEANNEHDFHLAMDTVTGMYSYLEKI